MGGAEDWGREGACGEGGVCGVREDGDEVVEGGVADGFRGGVGAVGVDDSCSADMSTTGVWRDGVAEESKVEGDGWEVSTSVCQRLGIYPVETCAGTSHNLHARREKVDELSIPWVHFRPGTPERFHYSGEVSPRAIA